MWTARHCQEIPVIGIVLLQREVQSGRRGGQGQDHWGFISHGKESWLPPEDKVSLQSLFSRECGTEPELGCDKDIKLATQGGAQLFSYSAAVPNTGHLLESSREL